VTCAYCKKSFESIAEPPPVHCKTCRKILRDLIYETVLCDTVRTLNGTRLGACDRPTGLVPLKRQDFYARTEMPCAGWTRFRDCFS